MKSRSSLAMSIEDVSEGQMKEHESEGALLGVTLYATVRTIGALTNIVHLHVPARGMIFGRVVH